MLPWRRPAEPKFRPLWQRHLDGGGSDGLNFLHLSKSSPVDPDAQRRQSTRKLQQMAATFFVVLVTLAFVKESLVSFHSLLFPSKRNIHGDSSLFDSSNSNNDSPTAAPSSQDQLITDELLDQVPIPPFFQFLVDTVEPLAETDRLVVLKAPRAGTTMIEHLLSRCFGQVVAATYSSPGSDGLEGEITALEVTTQKNGAMYWNVDLSTTEGIVKSKELQLINQNQTLVLVSPLLYDVSINLLNDQYRGRLFVMFRHPVERLVSLFYYLEKEDKLPQNVVTLQDFIKHNATSTSHNLWTRQLSHRVGYADELTVADERVARRVLRDKVLIGLMSEKGESLRRVQRLFQWSVDRPQVEQCHERLTNWDWPLKNRHTALSPDKEVYKLLQRKNALDLKLYAYAQVLFRQQAVLFPIDDK